MSGRLCWQAVLVVMLAAATVWAIIPGPNDPRYPDAIVDPRVKCEKAGVFPHPRDCSWYYRCVDRVKAGFFWTYYFSCEPGTLFHDDLDQCVHPSLIKSGPCATNTTTTTTSTTTALPIVECTGVPGTCTTYDICRPTKMEKMMCAKIHCPRTSSLQCGEGYLYDMKARRCVRPPAEADLCGTIPPPINITQIGELACSYENLRPSSDFISRLHCDTYVLCDGENFKEKKELCRHYYECYRDGQVWKAFRRSCRNNLLFSYKKDKCVPAPTEAEKCKANLI
ncbi:uncharacterized protein [Panulirus ornatus]